MPLHRCEVHQSLRRSSCRRGKETNRMRVSPLEFSADKPCTASLSAIDDLSFLHPRRGDETSTRVAQVLADRRVQAELLQPFELLLHTHGLHLVGVGLVIVIDVFLAGFQLWEEQIHIIVDRGMRAGTASKQRCLQRSLRDRR